VVSPSTLPGWPRASALVRQRGHIRKRGNSYQVLLYAGVDPLTGRELRMVESTTDRAEATRILNRMRAQVEAQQHARTRATLGAALDAWLRVHEAEETTLEGYHGYVRRCVTRYRCRDGQPSVDHRTTAPHECRTIRHRRPPGRRPATEVHDCQSAGCVLIECAPHQCKPMASSTIRQIHWILSAALAAAVRWDWIKSNPADAAKKPRQPTPQPEPPSAADAARITEAAWAQGPDWAPSCGW